MPPEEPAAGPAPISRRSLILGTGLGAASVVVVGKLLTNGGGAQPAKAAQPSVVVKGERTDSGPPSLDGADPAPPADHVFDRVISGGRVIDPDTGYDQIANVGIDGARITSISTAPLTGKATIDATDLVVAPGFIDLLSYEPNDYGSWFKIGDGVTTNLGMHGLNNTAAGFFEQYGSASQRPPVHYGGAYDDSFMRDHLKVRTVAASQSQIDRMVAQVEQSFADGYMGVSFEPEYTPWVTDEEINAMAAAVKKHEMPVTFHVRYSSPDEPGKDNATALAEVLQVARTTGASVHVDHITSTGGTHTMPQSIATLEQARADGVDVTACMYGYDFWATTAGSPRFDDGWQERFRITYSDLAIPGKGERLTEATFNKARRDNTLVAAYAIPEEDVVTGLQTDWIMIGSDAILEPANNNHPRATGCFTRVLGRYVRDQQVLSLPAALAKMTIMPAKRFGQRVPALQRKGRLQMGADADITIFDPATVSDTSTVDDPAQMAKGVSFVLVSGQVVKEGDTLHRDLRLGDPIKAQV
ncbi:MAG: amidohydrolase family protein [Acidimicrobiales bacterium]